MNYKTYVKSVSFRNSPSAEKNIVLETAKTENSISFVILTLHMLTAH